METHWIVSITAMSQVACDLDRSQGFYPRPQKFSKCPTTFSLLFLPKWQFSNEKNLMLWETKLWLKVNFSQHVQGSSKTSFWFVHVKDIYCSVGKNLRKFKVNFFSHKISLYSKSPTLVAFWPKRMSNEAVVFAFGKERLWWFKFVILEPCG